MPEPKNLHLDRRAEHLLTLGEGDEHDLLSTQDVADWFLCSKAFVQRSRSQNFGPPYIKLSRSHIIYRRSDIIEWLEARVVRHQDRKAGAP